MTRLGRFASALAYLGIGLGILEGAARIPDNNTTTPASLYAEIATTYGFPGAEITDSIAEQEEARTRRQIIEANQAELVDTVETDSGLSVEVRRVGLDNPSGLISVDPQAINASVDFLIQGLGALPPANVPDDVEAKIDEFQTRAAAGQLDNITITAVVSTDSDHYIPDIPEDLNHFVTGRNQMYETVRTVTIGQEWGQDSPAGESRSHFNPTILVSPYTGMLTTKTPLAGKYTLADVMVSETTEAEADKMQSTASTLHHELGHALLDTMDLNLSLDDEHEIVEGLEYAGNAYMLGKVPGETLAVPLIISPDA